MIFHTQIDDLARLYPMAIWSFGLLMYAAGALASLLAIAIVSKWQRKRGDA